MLSRLLPPEERLSHIVVMGMGEPLANVDKLLLALKFSSETGLAIMPFITISTVGLPPAMDKLSASKVSITWRFRCTHPMMLCEIASCL
ncbi:MAG: hypothetical protein U0894_10475 [Pirellulales bacterium]